MTTRGSGEIEWTSYDLPSKIDDLTDSSYTEFWYGPDRSRIRQYQSDTGTTLTYAGLLFEFEDAATDTYRHYVQAGDQVVALVERVGSTNTKQFLHRDHQGSVVKVTNAAGAVDQALAFDAWGLRRNASDWSALAYPFSGSHETERGYTGHEHLDMVGLIHMNGRVQDPVLGRFISADPFVQAPFNTQSHNRYSYVWNNPTSTTDPSGFFCNPSKPVCTDSERNDNVVRATCQTDNCREAVRQRDSAADNHSDSVNRWLARMQREDAAANGGSDSAAGFTGLPAFGSAIGAGNGGQRDNSLLSLVSIGVGFSPVGTGVDIVVLLFGYDLIAREHVSGFDRILGIIPGVSEFRRAGKVFDAVSDAAGGTTQILKGPIADAVPNNLPQQLALGAARQGQGTVIMRNLADDPRLAANYGPGEWVKMQYVLRGTDSNVTVHYFRNLTTNIDVEFKFK
jgi:RHS repeat-associated protein